MADVGDEGALHLLQIFAFWWSLKKRRLQRNMLRSIFAQRENQGDYYQLVKEWHLCHISSIGICATGPLQLTFRRP